MALEMDYTKNVYGQDQTFNKTYIRIKRIINYSKEDGCSFDIEIYRNNELTDFNNKIDSLGYHFPYNSKNELNVISECYIYLKNLKDFSNAINC